MTNGRIVSLHENKSEEVDAVVAVGGDGHTLDVIHKYDGHAPILGFNTGHRGFLTNRGISPVEFNASLVLGSVFITHLLPQLVVEVLGADGNWREAQCKGTNDAWLQHTTTQTPWLRVEVRTGNELRVIEKLACDAFLVAAPAGSTAYASSIVKRAAMLLDTPQLMLVGSAVSEPEDWQYAPIPDTSEVTIVVLDPAKRPVLAAVDGKPQGIVHGMRVRKSRVDGVELGFLPSQSLAGRIADKFFPKGT